MAVDTKEPRLDTGTNAQVKSGGQNASDGMVESPELKAPREGDEQFMARFFIVFLVVLVTVGFIAIYGLLFLR